MPQPTQADHEILNIGICLDHFAFDYTPAVSGKKVETELATVMRSSPASSEAD